MKNLNFTIITFYQFKKLKKLIFIKKLLKNFCSFHKIRGTILIAEEGINATVAGLSKPIKLLEKEIIKIGFNKLEKKRSFYNYMPFNRLKIKIKSEIVTFNEKKLNVEKKTGQHINSLQWNYLIKDNDVMVIDVRNNFEVEIGSFNTSLNPKTKNFTEFKKYINKKLLEYKDKKIAMFCTGGIRCEKASSYLIKSGYKNVFQLNGGIIEYAHQIKKNKLPSKFIGKNFVFDDRLGERITNDIIAKCHLCESIADNHINCNNDACHILFIICKKCDKKLDGCCSIECQNIYHLPIEKQREVRKKFSKKFKNNFRPSVSD